MLAHSRMDTAPQIGLVGMGRMGRIYTGVWTDPDAPGRLLAVASTDLEPSEDLLDDAGVEHRFDRAEALFELDDLDGVVIATPTHTHEDLVVRAARVGLHVYCEKPIALSVGQARRAIRAVEEAGVIFQVGFMRRFDADYRSAKKAVEEGRIGRPVTFKSVGRDPACPDPAFARPGRSGGLLVDMAIHDFDLAAWLMDSPVGRVHAEGARLVCDELEAVGDIDNAVVNLRMESGALGQVEVSRNAFYGYDVRTEVLGADGAVAIGRGSKDGYEELSSEKGTAEEAYLEERFGPAYRAEIRHFAECVRSGARPAVSGEEGLAALEVAEAARLSLEEERPVEVAEIRTGSVPDE